MSATKQEKNKALVLEAFDTSLQQAGLCTGRALRVAQLHSAQRSYRAGP
jgi:hypothetical protein